ncbi:MAG TPA: DUF2202 domain-containing protein [Anaerolineae bacterium]|nr:DUF2202 domain-containing protein [Anaerolineae bacterium]
MNKLTKTLLAGVVTLGVAFTSVVWSTPVSAAPIDRGGTVALPVIAGDDLSADEIAGLAFMREEEKLARDVYQTLGDLWGTQIFSNIARSEQAHMDAIGTLLDRYGIADPTDGNTIGEFTNADLQALYDDLVDLGSQSVADALSVGAIIEETDISDLLDELATVEHSNIQRVYSSLENGSENHLRAYVSTLARQTGETYEPQILDQTTFSQIVSSTTGRGRRSGRSF